MVYLRAAAMSDIGAIASVHVTGWHETYSDLLPPEILANLSVAEMADRWLNFLSRPFGGAFVAELDGTIVGFAHGTGQRVTSFNDRGFTGEITSLYVLKAHQRMGIGIALMKNVVRMLMRNGHTAATLWVLHNNRSARDFYEATGGKIVGEQEQIRNGFILKEIAYGWRDLTTIAPNPS